MNYIENGMLLGNDETETVSQEDYDFYWQDDIRKEATRCPNTSGFTESEQ